MFVCLSSGCYNKYQRLVVLELGAGCPKICQGGILVILN